MRIFSIAMICAAATHLAAAGTITGTVRAKGVAAAEQESSGGAYASKKYKAADLEKIDYDSIHDFVVYIEGPIAGTKAPAEPKMVMQKNVQFVPHVLPIMVGTKVDWPNEDEIFHNVFSKSSTKSFNLPLYKKGEKTEETVFDKPGEVDVFCSIHSKMSCIILVLENPYFDSTDSRGHYTITNVPAGTYTLVGWQERLFSKKKQITVPENGEVKVDFVLNPTQ